MGLDETDRAAIILMALGAGVAAILIGLVCRQCVVGRLEDDERRRGKAPPRMVVGNPSVAYFDPAPVPAGHYYPPSFGSPGSASNGGYAHMLIHKPNDSGPLEVDVVTPNKEDDIAGQITANNEYLMRDSRKSRRVTIAALDEAPAEVTEMLAQLDMKTSILKDADNTDFEADRLMSARTSLDFSSSPAKNSTTAVNADSESAESAVQAELAKAREAAKALDRNAQADKEVAEAEQIAQEEEAARREVEVKKAEAEAEAARLKKQTEEKAKQDAEEAARVAAKKNQVDQEKVAEYVSPTTSPGNAASPTSPGTSPSSKTAMSPRLAKLHAEAEAPPPFQIVRFKRPNPRT